MPEGPECHVIAGALDEKLRGKRLLSVRVLGGRYATHGPPQRMQDLNELARTSDVVIVRVGAKGKLIYWVLSSGFALLSTLGLSGSWKSTKSAHCDIEVTFGGNEKIYFRDPRHYGTLRIVPRGELEARLSSRGPDILVETVPRDDFLGLCERYQHWTLPKLLMDQSKISGVGNYLKAEILYAARADPTTPIGDLDPSTLARVHTELHRVPRAALKSKGVSLRDYELPDGEEGQFQSRLRVYGRKSDPEGHTVLRTRTTDGRTTHWVPELQSVKASVKNKCGPGSADHDA